MAHLPSARTMPSCFRGAEYSMLSMQMLSADLGDELVRLRRSALAARLIWDLKVGEDDCAVGDDS